MPQPFYEDSDVTIYHGDCRDVLPLVEADVLSVDPPYGTNEHGGYGRRQMGLETIANDDDTSVRDAVLAYWGDRDAVVFGSPRTPEPAGRWDARLVWDKRQPGLGAPWRWQHEMIYVRGAWSNKPGVPSVLSYAAGNAMRDRYHPHEKPVALMVALLKGSTGVIVDTCMGSGSTLRAAKDLGRKAIGIDVDEQCCEIAARRLSQGALTEMFR